MSLVFVAVWALSNLLAIELIRALPLPSSWKQTKPISCDVCMSGWCAIFHLAVDRAHFIEVVGAAGLTLLVLVVLIGPRRGPPEWD